VKKVSIIFLLCLFLAPLNVYSEEAVIENFRNLLFVKFTSTYNFIVLEQIPQEQSYYTNRPVDVGFGIGVKNIFAGFSMSLPFGYDSSYEKSSSFDLNFNRYAKNNYSNGFMKYYSGFNDGIEFSYELRIINLGYSKIFVFNDEHSIRSAYNLDQKQNISNGSFLLGGGMFFSSIKSDSSALVDYSDSLNAFYTGPIFGYSYTIVFSNNFFINMLAAAGLNIINSGEFSYGIQALPKISAGYHSKKWSANIYSNCVYLINQHNEALDYNLFSGNIGLSYIRRLL